MGVVYEAEALSLHRRVALKVLPFAAELDTRQLQRFKNKAQAAACLHHSNIVPIYAVGCDRGVHFYAMQTHRRPIVGRGDRAAAARPRRSEDDEETPQRRRSPRRLRHGSRNTFAP